MFDNLKLAYRTSRLLAPESPVCLRKKLLEVEPYRGLVEMQIFEQTILHGHAIRQWFFIQPIN